MKRTTIAGLVALSLFGCTKRVPTGAPTTRVVTARLIRTMDSQRPTAEALVVRDGKLLFVGSEKEALDVAGPGAAVERFPAATIVPGLTDAHGHLDGLGQSLAIADLSVATSEVDAVAILERAAATSKQGDWLIGRGWNQNAWPTKQFPTKASLDARFPHTPVLLSRIDGHASWANSEALRRAGISEASVDPEGGRMVRDEKGALTGVFLDASRDALFKAMPPLSDEDLKRSLHLALQHCVKLGLTQVHDAGMPLRVFNVLKAWDAQGLLPLRIYAMADGQGADHEAYLALGPFTGNRLTMRAVKLAMDGALGSRGAALREPYADEPTTKGLLLMSQAALETRASAFAARGFQVAVHAIGDEAVTEVLNVLSKLEQQHPGARHRVEHAQILLADDVGRFAKSGVIASYQPTHATSDMPWAEARLGPQRLAHAYAWKEVLNTGAHVAFGSDFPVESANPLWGLYAARTRQDHAGQPTGGWWPSQRVTGEEALAGFTTGAAYAAFEESTEGMLHAAYDADFVVLPIDPVEGDAKALLTAQPVMTVVGGADSYRAP